MQTLPTEVTRLSEEAITAVWNPGIGSRRHLVHRLKSIQSTASF